jgi:hypothetical protein
MTAMASQVVIDEQSVQANTQNYEYALERALVYLLSRDSETNLHLCRNLIAIRRHLLVPREGLAYKTWLLSWTSELYWTWAYPVYEREQVILIKTVRTVAPNL